MHEGFCRDCEAPILWLTSPKNRNTPINREPTVNGNIVIDMEAGTWQLATPVDRMLHATELYVTHFTTCPAAHQRRRRR